MKSFLTRVVLPSLMAVNTMVFAADKNNEPVEVGYEEMDRAVDLFAPSKKLRLSSLGQRHIDGVKGYVIRAGQEPPVSDASGSREQMLANLACNASAFGLVQLQNSKSFVGKNETGVFTKYRFRVVRNWSARAGRGDQFVNLIVHGGEIEHAGERFRVENPLANYKIDSFYILVTGTRNSSDHGHTIYAQPPFIDVQNNTIYPSPGVNIFAAGTTVKQAETEVSKAVVMKGCQ